MEVYGSVSVPLGSITAVEHSRIRLNTVASSVPVEGGHDHFMLLDDVERVEGNRVHMAVAGTEAVHPRYGATADYPERGAIDPRAILDG